MGASRNDDINIRDTAAATAGAAAALAGLAQSSRSQITSSTNNSMSLPSSFSAGAGIYAGRKRSREEGEEVSFLHPPTRRFSQPSGLGTSVYSAASQAFNLLPPPIIDGQSMSQSQAYDRPNEFSDGRSGLDWSARPGGPPLSGGRTHEAAAPGDSWGDGERRGLDRLPWGK